MQNDIIFVDIYGNEFTSFVGVCSKYNINRKTLTSRKTKAINKGITDTYAILDRCIMDYSEQYQKDWEKLASEERRENYYKFFEKPYVYTDIFGTRYKSYTDVIIKYKLQPKSIYDEKKKYRKELSENTLNEITVIDKCIVSKNAAYKKDFMSKASDERKNDLLKIYNDKNDKNDKISDKHTKNDSDMTVKEKNLRKRVAEVGKFFIKQSDVKKTDVKKADVKKTDVKKTDVKTENTVKSVNIVECINETCEYAVKVINETSTNLINVIKELQSKIGAKTGDAKRSNHVKESNKDLKTVKVSDSNKDLKTVKVSEPIK